jgi:hypothetical protein
LKNNRQQSGGLSQTWLLGDFGGLFNAAAPQSQKTTADHQPTHKEKTHANTHTRQRGAPLSACNLRIATRMDFLFSFLSLLAFF